MMKALVFLSVLAIIAGLACSSSLPVQKVPVKKVQSTECDVCKIVAQVLEQFALENSTEAEIKQKIEEVCKSLPSTVSGMCSDLVDMYFDEIWNDIINDETPDDICTDIGLCTSKKLIKESPKVPVEKVDASIECTVCKLVAQVLEKFAEENSTEAEVKQEIEKFCNELPSALSGTCLDLVNDYFDEIWNAIINNETPEDICKDIDLCTSAKVAPKVVEKVDASIECTICKLVAEVLEKFAEENSTEAEVKQEIEKFCNELPSALSGTCLDLVNDYFDEIWEAIINDETPEDICKDLDLCTSAKVAPKVPVKEVKSTECDICKIVVQVVEQFALENSTEAEVKQEIEQFCKSLPSAVSGTCSNLVDQYFDEIWTAIINDETPEDVCKDIDLCTSKVALEQTPCDYCKLVVSFLDVYVDENKTEEEILNDLEVVCNLFPGSTADECNDFVKEYFPIIYEFVKEEFDNDLICYEIMVCTNISQVRRNPKVTKLHDLQSNASCQLCMAVANFLKPFVNSTADEDDVKKALEEFCSILPNTNNISAECMKYVNEYFVPIWTLVKAEVESNEICALLGFCKSDTQTMRTIQTPVRKSEAGVLCVICEYVMKEIESQLPINATEADIIKVVMDICDALPTTIQKECTDFINEYGQEIINALINDVGPNAVCALLHLCTIEDAAVMETPVGGSKCSWGPAYWCSTPEAAIECNAKDYCSGQKQL